MMVHLRYEDAPSEPFGVVALHGRDEGPETSAFSAHGNIKSLRSFPHLIGNGCYEYRNGSAPPTLRRRE